MKIVRTDSMLEMPRVDAALRAAGHDLVLLPDGVEQATLARELADADLLLMCYTPVPAAVIDAAPRLRGIIKYGVGIDAIDIPAAIRRGIPVVNIPEYAEETVAEGTIALLLSLARQFKPLQREMESKGWAWPTARWMGLDLAGKTLGLVGAGRIGRSVARMAGAGFRMRVLAYDPHVSRETLAAAGIEKRLELCQMLPDCDFVSIHCVLNPSTRGIYSTREFALMKPTAFLLNSSRGEIVNEKALLEALTGGWIAGAGLDVYGSEPLALSGHTLSVLHGMDNVLLWPHLTFYTAEAMQRLEEETLARCSEVIEGRPVLVKSHDPRLRAQSRGVTFAP